MRTTRILSAAVVSLSLMLAAALYTLAGLGDPVVEESVYGSYLLSQSSGGYILVAVIAFTLGIFIAAAIYHFRGRR